MQSQGFRNLNVWKEAMCLVDDIYEVTRTFPAEERYGLTAQIRKAAVSIPPNIGEGARRKRKKAYLNHLDIALGSQGDVDVQLEIASRQRFCTKADYRRIVERVDRIGKMLNRLIESLQPDHRFWEY